MRKEFKGMQWAIIDIHSGDLAPVAIYNSRAEAFHVCREQQRYVNAVLAATGLDPKMVSAYRVVGYLDSKVIFNK